MHAPNWFIALPVDGTFLRDLPPPPEGLRGFRPEDLHLTVAFWGGCSATAAQAAWATLDRLLLSRPRAPFAYSLAGIVPMGRLPKWSALAAELREGQSEAMALLTALRDPLIAASGGPPDTREPKAHVTLARPTRRVSSAERKRGLAWGRDLRLDEARGTFDRVALYTWATDRSAGLFQVQSVRPLG